MTQRIILASASPRRRVLLEQIGIACDVVPADIDESPFDDEDPVNYVKRVAAGKAVAINAGAPERIVLAADTGVVIEDTILGKPADREDFLQMFVRLSGRRHEVISAVCVMLGENAHLETSISHVDFREVTEEEMCDYWDTGEPADKAGGYGIQGLGALFVKNISGSYSGIMGLPLFETLKLLRKVGIDPLKG